MKVDIIAEIEDVGKRVDLFVSEKAEISRGQVKKLFEEDKIELNGKKSKISHKIKDGDVVSYQKEEPKALEILAEDIDFEIVYEDDDIAIINKPQGLIVHPTIQSTSGTLVNGLMNKLTNLSGINGVMRPGIVHRIDKDTSGLLMVAKNDTAHKSLSKQIEEKSAKRVYIALCEGKFKSKSGKIENKIGRSRTNRKKMSVNFDGKHALTKYKVLCEFDKYSLVEFALETGRTHQIRVHAKFLGNPVVGDMTYGYLKQKFQVKGQLLHAVKLVLTHPSTEKRQTFFAPLPKYFSDVIEIIAKEENREINIQDEINKIIVE